ncbi:MAG: VWA domain-containing protein [Bacteroidetes bacterium]|nr:VWA domain-containing protein [Bacteroidota bacterium]
MIAVIVPPMIVWYILRGRDANASVQISDTGALKKAPGTYRHYLRHLLIALRVIAVSMIVVVIARPQSNEKSVEVTSEGIDIVLALDISSSMLAEDFRPNRLEAAKDVAMEFIGGRPTDRIGLVVFSGESFTQCPLTTDHSVLKNLFRDLKSGMIEDGTAIGMGLANAVSRLKDSESKSKVAILLTDGVNNKGDIAPMTAAEIAKTFDIRVYTIGVGTLGTARYPFQTPFGIQYQNVDVQIDEDVLKEIAALTGAQYFRATNENKLRDIYKEIDQMEKSRVEVIEFSKDIDEFFWFALTAVLAFCLEIILRYTILNTIP